MNADGSGQVNLSNSPYLESNAAFSPDGGKIAFEGCPGDDAEIYVMNLDGPA